MKKSAYSLPFLLLLGVAALFVRQTSRDLPPLVATHFGAGGAANGFMSREFYLRFMLAFVVLLPWLVNFAFERILRSPNARPTLASTCPTAIIGLPTGSGNRRLNFCCGT